MLNYDSSNGARTLSRVQEVILELKQQNQLISSLKVAAAANISLFDLHEFLPLVHQEMSGLRAELDKAFLQLISTGRPVNRRALAALANCDPRTVSKHKDIWSREIPSPRKTLNPNDHLKRQLELAVARVENDIESMSEADLRGLIGTMNFFEYMAANDEQLLFVKRASEKIRLTVKKRAAKSSSHR